MGYDGGPLDSMPYIFIAVLIVVVVVAIAKACLSTKRREALFTLATQMGWTYSADDMFDIPSAYAFFGCLNKGRDRKASNLMFGQFFDVDFKAFDYTYTTGSGKSQNTTCLTAVVMRGKIPLKPLFVRPENFADHLAGMIGFEDIDFEWDEFNRAFYVKAADKQFAYDVISQKMMQFLMENKGWCLEASGLDLIVYTGRTFNIEDYTAALSFAGSFLKLLPDYLADKLGSP